MSSLKRFTTGAAACVVLGLAEGASAQPSSTTAIEPGSAVAVVVKVAKPWYAPTSIVIGKMRDTIAQYESLPGLAHKAFSLARPDAQYGGIYLWKDEASARAFFGPAWFKRVENERGVKPQVHFYDVPVAIENANRIAPDHADAVATIVTVATPPGMSKARLTQEFQLAIPIYREVPGLLRKYFVLTDDGKFGGIYLWKDQASAQQWFTDAWHQRVRLTYGAPAMIEWFDTPILLPSKLAGNRPAIPGF